MPAAAKQKTPVRPTAAKQKTPLRPSAAKQKTPVRPAAAKQKTPLRPAAANQKTALRLAANQKTQLMPTATVHQRVVVGFSTSAAFVVDVTQPSIRYKQCHSVPVNVTHRLFVVFNVRIQNCNYKDESMQFWKSPLPLTQLCELLRFVHKFIVFFFIRSCMLIGCKIQKRKSLWVILHTSHVPTAENSALVWLTFIMAQRRTA